MKITRQWAMPSPDTFSIKPIGELLDRWLLGRSAIIDPFSRNSSRANLTNDLNSDTSATHHLDAVEWLDMLIRDGQEMKIAAALLDPPYSPRQIAECYKGVGRKIGMKDTQSAVLYSECKDRMARLLVSGGVAITCGWNSQGFGLNRGFTMHEILLVACGGAHNDYIVTVETKNECFL